MGVPIKQRDSSYTEGKLLIKKAFKTSEILLYRYGKFYNALKYLESTT